MPQCRAFFRKTTLFPLCTYRTVAVLLQCCLKTSPVFGRRPHGCDNAGLFFGRPPHSFDVRVVLLLYCRKTSPLTKKCVVSHSKCVVWHSKYVVSHSRCVVWHFRRVVSHSTVAVLSENEPFNKRESLVELSFSTMQYSFSKDDPFGRINGSFSDSTVFFLFSDNTIFFWTLFVRASAFSDDTVLFLERRSHSSEFVWCCCSTHSLTHTFFSPLSVARF